jgi:hypothetical protein
LGINIVTDTRLRIGVTCHLILSFDCCVVFCCRLELWQDPHMEYLTKGLRHLGPNFHVLDAK